MTQNAETMSYELAKSLPIGTIAADAEGYWARTGRRYLKTTSNTWALFFEEPTAAEVAEAISSRKNNISPAPLGELMDIRVPELFPGTLNTLASLSIRG